MYSPIDFLEFDALQESTSEVFARCLAIATIAHMYELVPAANWAIDKAIQSFTTSPRMSRIPQLVETASRWGRDSKRYLAARDGVCGALRAWACQGFRTTVQGQKHPFSKLSIAAVLAALDDPERRDTYVLAHAYYYLLVTTDDRFKHSVELRPIDHQRLLAGFYRLTRSGRLRLDDLGAQPDLEVILQLDRAISDCRDELWSYFNPEGWPQLAPTNV